MTDLPPPPPPPPPGQPQQGWYPWQGAPPSRDSIPELGRTLASPWLRILARIIDGVILAIVASILATAMFDGGDVFSFRRTILQTVLTALYEVLFIGLRGATPGKALVGIAVVRQRDGVTPPGVDVGFLRWVVEAVGLLTIVGALIGLVIFVLNVIYLFTDPRRRTINDRIAKTYVVKVR